MSRPLVRPKVVSQVTAESLFLEDALEPILARADSGAICLFGALGSGKSSALKYLSTRLPKSPIVELLDDPDRTRVAETADRMVVIYTAMEPLSVPHLAELWLAPWGQDEALEYLLAAHRDRCASVMNRIRGSRNLPDLPELWTICLDVMAEDEGAVDVEAALRRHLDRHLPPAIRKRAREICFKKTVTPEAEGVDEVQLWGHHGFLGFLLGAGLPAEEVRLVRDPRIRQMLAAEHLVDPALGTVLTEGLRTALPEGLLAAAGRILREHPATQKGLDQYLQDDVLLQPMGASLLHAARSGWRPADFGKFHWFSGAHLAGADWAGLRLPNAQFGRSTVTGANLRGASLDDVDLHQARLNRAVLSESSLRRIRADGADLSGADLSRVFAQSGWFRNTSLRGASLEGALLSDSCFIGADLTGARFCRADLAGAAFHLTLENQDWMESFVTLEQAIAHMKEKGVLQENAPYRRTELDGTDFTGADLQKASMQFADLRTAVLSGTLLMEADLQRANLERVEIAGARFDRARLNYATLTGSIMPGASFRGARLCSARLADVDWERADLRHANLRRATFHLGTSRSGLVFGGPSEGTRNGYYTDEYSDQSYKPPEEIRVANLRGADLRGALLEGTDFYLVDLREAHYTSEQAEVLRRCGAILETRV